MNNASYFLLRRLHSLLGIFPLGLFLFNHLLTNSTAMISAEFFEEKVKLIHMLGPLLPIVEAVLIFVPLSLHIALGIYIATQGKIEISGLPYRRNYAYAFQRWTGWIALVYIAYHVIHLRFMHDMHAEPFSLVLARMFNEGMWGIPGIAWIAFYLVGGPRGPRRRPCSLVPVKRSHSVCAQGGINASVNTKGEGDSPPGPPRRDGYGGDFLADQPPVKGMADAAPGIVFMLDRMGVPFNRTPEGLLDFRRFGGTLFHRTAFAARPRGSSSSTPSTSRCAASRRWTSTDEPASSREARCASSSSGTSSRARPRRRGRLRGGIARRTSRRCRSARSRRRRVPRDGRPGHGLRAQHQLERDQHRHGRRARVPAGRDLRERRVHPGAPDGDPGRRQAAPDLRERARRGRPRVGAERPKDRATRQGDPRGRARLLPRARYPKYGNLVPRDIASREIFQTVLPRGLTAPGARTSVYLDVTHLTSTQSPGKPAQEARAASSRSTRSSRGRPLQEPDEDLPRRALLHGRPVGRLREGRARLAQARLGAQPARRTSPASTPTGECDYQYHGANRLGANSLLSCIYGGMVNDRHREVAMTCEAPRPRIYK
jgi:succinate dehydrogenase/fumarate reductase cytochrome b subunit (b558 family)